MNIVATQKHKKKVTQSNKLVEASYHLGIDEKRLLMIGATKFDSRSDVPDKTTITAQEFSDTFSVSIDSAYGQLKAAKDSLYDRDIRFNDEDSEERVRWVHRVTYHKRRGSVTLYWSPDIKPYIGQLGRKFSSYYIESMSELTSFHSIRIYELLMQYIDYGQRWFTEDDLRKKLLLEDKYARYTDLRRYVIKKSVDELNLKTDLDVSFKAEKEGNKVVKIWFFYNYKVQQEIKFS